jgi:hypothetical protein
MAGGDDSLSVSTYSQKRMPIQIQANPTTLLLLRTIINAQKQKLSGIA